MANNPYVNKVEYGGNVLIDLTDDLVTPEQLLFPATAHDRSGAPIVGSIASKVAATYNTSTSDQTIAAGQYLSGAQTIRKVTTANISAANIKYGVTAKVGDAGDDDRILGVTGTFTGASTVSSGQTAAGSPQILSGYSAFIDGAEVKGNIAAKTSADLTVEGDTVTAPAGYYSTAASATVAAGSAATPATSITANPTISVDPAGNIVATVSATKQITPTVTAGYVTSGVAGTATVSGTKSVKLTHAFVQETLTTVSGTTATRGHINVSAQSWTGADGVGYDTGEIGVATFTNTAESGVTYVDISGTTDAPVLVSGGFLYINKGWTDDLKISLAKLVPDGASAGLASNKILSGYSAYDNNGTLIAGSIPSKAAQTYTPTTSNQTIAAGQYLSGAQTIKGDANLVADKIRSGYSIFGVAGSYVGITVSYTETDNESGGKTVSIVVTEPAAAS